MFHPKIYLFFNSNADWECLIGSANLTKSACTENAEIVAHISSNDEGSKKALKKIQAQIKTYWNVSESISNEDFNHYYNVWNRNTDVKVYQNQRLKIYQREQRVYHSFSHFHRKALNIFRRELNVVPLFVVLSYFLASFNRTAFGTGLIC